MPTLCWSPLRRLAARARPLASALLPCALVACAGPTPPAAPATDAPRLAYRLEGQGNGPTVVLQSGLGDSRQVWSVLLPRLRARHPVFSVDRPGYGDSPLADGPRDPCTQARELRHTLQAAGVAPPYLLVGHSLGGLYQHAFARLYPQEVAGLLLIEPTHPQHWATMTREAPAMAAIVRTLRATVFTTAMRQEFDAQTQCLDALPPLSSAPPPALLLRRSAFPPLEQGAFADMASRLWLDWRVLAAVQRVDHLPGDDHDLQRHAPAEVAAAIDALAACAAVDRPGGTEGRRCPR